MSTPVYFFDASALNDDDACLLHAAQGLLNREGPVLWTEWRRESGLLSPVRAEQWVDSVEIELRNYLSKKFDLAFEELSTLEDVLRLAKTVTRTFVIHDPDVPESLNVATTMAGLKTALLAAPQHIPLLESLGFTPGTDLRRSFYGMSKSGVVEWALKNLYPDCTPDLLLERTVPDMRSFKLQKPAREVQLRITSLHKDLFPWPAELAKAGLRDAAGTPLSDLDRHHIAQPHYVTGGLNSTDDRKLETVTEYTLHSPEQPAQVLILYVTGTYQVEIKTDADPHWVELTRQDTPPSYNQSISYTVEFSPFMRDLAVARKLFCFDLSSSPNTPEQRKCKQTLLETLPPVSTILGWHSTYGSEHDHILQISEAGHTGSAALSAHNFSFLQHLKQEPLQCRPAPPPPALDPEKIYLGFIVGDGDAMGICYHLMRGMFREEGRGQVPMGLSLQGLLQDLAPGLLHYYLDHLNENDTVLFAASGAGYSYADSMTPEQLDRYVRWTREWVEPFRPHALYFLGNPIACGGTGVRPDQREIYAKHLGDLIPGTIDGYIRYGNEPNGEDSLHQDFVWAQTRAPDVGENDDWTVMDPEPLFAQLQSLTAKKKPGIPLFVPVHPWIDKKIGPAKILEWSKQLGPEFEIVRPDHLLMLMRHWMNPRT